MNKIFLFIAYLFLFLLLTQVRARAEEIYTTDKLITVDISKQKLYAWEGGRMVYETTVSTGVSKAPTVKGKFKIYWKLPRQDMRGINPVYGKYFHKDVPNVMYFYKAYAIHGAYWHTAFGRRVSNGCVNLPVEASQWIYDFAPVGTQVIIY